MPRLLSEEVDAALRDIDCIKATLSANSRSSDRGNGNGNDDETEPSYLGLRAPQDRLPLLELLKLSLGQLDRLREKEIEVLKAATASAAASCACFPPTTDARECAGLGRPRSPLEDPEPRPSDNTAEESQTVSDVTSWAACRALLDSTGVGDIRMVDSPVPRGDLSVAVEVLQQFRWPDLREVSSPFALGAESAGVGVVVGAGSAGGGTATPPPGPRYRATGEAERGRLVAYLNAVLYPGCGNEWLVPVGDRNGDTSHPDFLSIPCGDVSWRGRSRGNAAGTEAGTSRSGIVRGDAPSAAVCLSEAVRCGAPSSGLRLLLEVVRPPASTPSTAAAAAAAAACAPSIASVADNESSSTSGNTSRRGSGNAGGRSGGGGAEGAEGASGQAALYRAIAVLVAANRRSPLTRPVVVLTDLQDAWKLLWLGRGGGGSAAAAGTGTAAGHGKSDVFVWRMKPADATSVVRSMLNDEIAGWDGQVSWQPRSATGNGTGGFHGGADGRAGAAGRDGGRLSGDGPMASLRERHLIGKRRHWQHHRHVPSLPPPTPPPPPPLRERAGTEGMEHYIGGIVRALSPPLAMEMALRRGGSSSFTGNSLPGQRISGASAGVGSTLGDGGDYNLQPRESRAFSAGMYGADRAGGEMAPVRSSFSGSYPRSGAGAGAGASYHVDEGYGFDDHLGGVQQQHSNGHLHNGNCGIVSANGAPTPTGYLSGGGSGFGGGGRGGGRGGGGGAVSSDSNGVARRSSSPHAAAAAVAAAIGATGDPAILRHIIPFAAGEGFLFVAGVCSSWRDAWGIERPPETSVDAAVQSPERLGWARASGLGWCANVCERAAAGGHLATLRYARALGCPWDWRTCAHAVTKALVPVSAMIPWAASKPAPTPSSRFTRFVRDVGDHGPSQERRLEVLKWCRENGCPWDESTTSEAAREGNLDVLRYARANGCPWNVLTCAYAAAAGHLEVLKWAREEEGCGWNEATCAFAAAGGHLEVIKWARENGCRWGEETCASAARGGRLEVLKWCRENGCPWGGGTCANAAEGGHFEVLKWCRENGCPWTEATCTLAAREGQLEILKWCHNNGCSWGASTFRAAAGARNMEMLRFLFENGCPWDRRTCAAAAKNADLDTLKWLRSNGCPWDSRTLDAAAAAGAMDVFEWATSQRCPV